MMNKTLKKILTCLLICFIFASAAGFIITFAPEKAYAFTGLTDITEEDLYNQTNTFNISSSCFDDNGNFRIAEDQNRKISKKQYHLLYDMSHKNDNEVMDTAQITVLTPGLGSYAGVWSNACSKDTNASFAYDSQSIIAKIRKEVGNVNIYWVKCTEDFRFNLYNITDETEEGKKYTDDNEIKNITDISKHIIIVFEVDDATESHDNVYYQLNYALSKIMYDVKILNGGKLPKLNLIGHSRGGITNLQFTLDHPDLVESLVSIGAPYFASTTARIFGKIISKDTDGLDDILNSELYYGYNKRWNNNYDNLYKDVNVYAYGSYHTLMSISEAMFYDMSGKINDLGATGIAALFSAINAAKIATGFHHFGEQLVLKLIAECLDTLYPDSAVVDAAEILFKELDFDIYPSFVSWFNDILVPLDSQLGEDGGNTEDGTGTYRGFRRIVRPFIGGDADYTKVAQKEPPVGHNLEPRDAVIINNIICNLDFGVNTNSGYLISEKDDGTVRVEGYKGTYSSDNLVIPSSINGKTVTEIAPFAFLGLDKSNIKTITLGDSIEKIGMYAFSDFTEAENISIGTDSHLKEIREGAFNNCSKITVMKFPATLENIIPTALMNCNSLTAVTVPGNNAKYSSVDGVLYTKNKEMLKLYPAGRQSESYTVDNSCIAIGDYAFINNADIASLNLNNVNSIDFYGIFNCEKLADVVAPKLDYVEQGAFYKTLWLDNNSAEFVILGNVLIRYQGNATDLKISNVTSIAPAAFIANDTITSISLGGDLVNIGRYAFYSCEKLEKVYIDNLDSLIYIGTDSFGKNAENREIYVPFTLKEEYSANELWNQYNTKTYETNINYSLNGGLFADNESYPQTIEYGNIWNIPDPVRTAYSFDGWYIVDQNGNVSDEKITNGQIWKNYDENVTLSAKWSPVQYTIILVADGGTVSETNLHYTIENSVSLPSPEYDGYTFNGWYADSNLTEDSYVGNSLQKGTYGDKIFYAKRTANSYTVSLNLKDSEKDPGKVNQTTVKVTFNNSYILPVAERNGYIFDGWEDANGELYTTEEGVSFKPWDVAEDTELFARWTVKKYYIKVDANGTIFWIGAGGFSDTRVSIEYGTKFKNITELAFV